MSNIYYWPYDRVWFGIENDGDDKTYVDCNGQRKVINEEELKEIKAKQLELYDKLYPQFKPK